MAGMSEDERARLRALDAQPRVREEVERRLTALREGRANAPSRHVEPEPRGEA